MAELTTIARPYAKAAFQYAQESGTLPQWESMLGLAAGLVQDADMNAFLDQPQVDTAAKVAAFAQVGGDEFDQPCLNFLAQCAEHKRLDALVEIYDLFHQQLLATEHTAEVELVSAFELSDAAVNALVAKLKQQLGCEINVNQRVDNTLIGGVVIRTGDTVIDGSVRGRLAGLAEQLNA